VCRGQDVGGFAMDVKIDNPSNRPTWWCGIRAAAAPMASAQHAEFAGIDQ
jgi:hypothetical protein